MTDRLALLGGTPAIPRPLELFRSMSEDEVTAAARVIRSGVLSAYIGAPGDGFLGGSEVRAFERKAAEYFGVRHAITVNSWTSGLVCAVGAIGIEPGDEVITTPWTMSATAMAILHWNAIPVFADIDPVSFNLDPSSVEACIGPRTRAILAADIFGQSADIPALRRIADRHGIRLLTDTAQAPGSRAGATFTGTRADIGGFSLNYHKHIHCGEGGILVTDDDALADRMRLIRNHAESVIKSDDPAVLSNMIGHNMRMGEIECAIASVQLDKLAPRVASRQRVARQLDEGLAGLPGLTTPRVMPGGTHVYYVYGMTLDPDQAGTPRSRIVEALKAEGVPGLMAGYQNLHLLPAFRHRIAFGPHGFPWTSPYVSRDVTYAPGLCPVAERLHNETFFGMNLCMFEFPPDDVDLVIAAFHKVWRLLGRAPVASR
jgi:dTDP-4-amino-4,6-dideoxygalactose transaminase